MHWRAAIIAAILTGLLFSYKGRSEGRVKHLQNFAESLGYKRDPSIFRAIDFAATAYGINPYKMVVIGITESSLKHRAIMINKNGTKDVGMFQINDVNKTGVCKEYNTAALIGNSLCAAKLLKYHEKHSKKDPYWVGRYHSKTPSKKRSYVDRLKRNGLNEARNR